MQVLDNGVAADVGPIGMMRRNYRIRRRVGAVRIEIGQGAVNLPLAPAIRLANLLHGSLYLAEPIAA